MYEVPTADWQRLCVYVTGVEAEQKGELRKLVITLGAKMEFSL
jgi:hypothetical protein